MRHQQPPEIMVAMEVAKSTIKEDLRANNTLLKQVMDCYDRRWENQMEQKLYGAALFLNTGKFFAIREKDRRQATRLRSMFNDVLKMVLDDDEQCKISKQTDDYERSEGDCFSKPMAIRERDNKNPSKFLPFNPCLLICFVAPYLKLYLPCSFVVGIIWWPSI